MIEQKILIVDDRPANLYALENVLRDVDVTVIKANNGNEALISTLNHDFSLAILDVQMPEMDGYELAELLRSEEKTRFMPVIFLSAVFSDDFHVFKGYKSGAVDFITKPFNPDILLNKVKVFLELDRKNAELKLQHTKLEELINTLNITNTKLQGEIDERTIAEIKLRESEKMLKELNATKDKFFSIVAHDLKNPFNTLIGFSNLLLNTGLNLSEEKKTNYLELIYKASKRGYSLLENLLEWSRSQTGRLEIKPQEFVLKQSIKECMNLHYSSAEKKFVSLTEQIDDTTKVFADVNMFTTVMRNLISNAIKFTPENGKIDITAIEKETEVQINVSDTGLGVSKESKEKLFRIDVNHSTPGTNQEQGTGLGLILCKEFIEKNKGKIWVESALGEGSIFSFTLPKKVF